MEHHLRPAAPSDLDFLNALHCATMRDVIERTWGWNEAWQRADFCRRFAEYIVSIIETEGRAAGSVWLETPEHERRERWSSILSTGSSRVTPT